MAANRTRKANSRKSNRQKHFVGIHGMHKTVLDDFTGKQYIERKALHTAVLANDVPKLHQLMQEGVDISAPDRKGRTALHFAVTSGSSELVEFLLSNGADVNSMDFLGNTPLHLAVCSSHIQIVTLLLKAGTNLNLENNFGKNPINLANSRLKIVGEFESNSSMLKTKVMEILHMLQVYYQRQEKHEHDMEHLHDLATKLSISETRDDISKIQDLLIDFTMDCQSASGRAPQCQCTQ